MYFTEPSGSMLQRSTFTSRVVAPVCTTASSLFAVRRNWMRRASR